MTVETIQYYRVRDWFALEGDKTLRLDYDLNENSIVLDVGGYRGDFAQAIYERYRCNIYIFEPHPDYAAAIKIRFAENPKITVFEYGLGESDGLVKFGTDGDATSSFREAGGHHSVYAQVRNVTTVLQSLRLPHIDLMKINVEGAEYGIIDSLHTAGLMSEIDNYQIQFHDFVPDARARLKRAHEILQSTHSPTYLFSFVWENWRCKSASEDTAVQQTLLLTVDQLRERLSNGEREIDRLKEEVAELVAVFRQFRQDMSKGRDKPTAPSAGETEIDRSFSGEDGSSRQPIDEDWYALAYPDAVQDVQEGIYPSLQRHYDLVGINQSRIPWRPLVDKSWYLRQYPEVSRYIEDGIYSSAEEHFFSAGIFDGKLPSIPFVDEEFYLNRYPDIKVAVEAGQLESGLAHYVEYGFREHRKPNPDSTPFRSERDEQAAAQYVQKRYSPDSAAF